MNKRIQELEKLATPRCYDENGCYIGNKFDINKFAELIVKECTEVLLKWKGEPFPFDEDLAASLIKEHFEV